MGKANSFHSEKNFRQCGDEAEAVPFCSEAQIKKKTKCAIDAAADLGFKGSEPASAITPAIYPWKEVAEAEEVIIAIGVRVEYGGQRPAYKTGR